MKHLQKLPLAGTLLVSYLVYSAFVPVSIAHSIILCSLAAFAAYDKFLVTTKSPSMELLVSSLRLEIDSKLEKQKENYEAKLQALESEQSRQAIAKINSGSSASIKKPSIQF